MLHSANYTDATQAASRMNYCSINETCFTAALQISPLRLYTANQKGFELLTKHFHEVYEQTQKPKLVSATNMQYTI
jgi:hypothetical protein